MRCRSLQRSFMGYRLLLSEDLFCIFPVLIHSAVGLRAKSTMHFFSPADSFGLLWRFLLSLKTESGPHYTYLQ